MNQAIAREDNVIDLKAIRDKVKPALITGGPTGPENWLKALERGTVFLARSKNLPANIDKMSKLILNKYMLWEHATQSTNLLWATPDGKQIDIWVNALEFSREFDLKDIIGHVVLEEKEGMDNGLAPETEESGAPQRVEAPEGTEGSSEAEPS